MRSAASDGEAPRGELPAGAFRDWLASAEAATAGRGDADVPCGRCVACCASSQFVLVEPDEADALAAIPPDLLFPAPRLPAGFRVLGYDDAGRCPMLRDDGCSIYPARPRACRQYDCRVLAAAGADVAEDKPAIAAQAARWRFDLPTPGDRERLAAVRAAASFLRSGPLLDEARPPTPTAVAVVAVRLHRLFLGATPDPADVAAAVAALAPSRGAGQRGPGAP